MDDDNPGPDGGRQAGEPDARNTCLRELQLGSPHAQEWTGWSQEKFLDVLAAVAGGTVAGRAGGDAPRPEAPSTTRRRSHGATARS